MTDNNNPLNWVDYLLIGIYLVATFSIGLWSALKERKKTSSSSGYFLAGRSMSWWTIALSLYMSNIGSNTFVGTAGAAAANGYGVLCYEFVGIYSLLLLAYFFVPIYLTSGVFTMPEYIQRRFGGKRLQILLAVQSLLMYIFAKLSIEIYAGALIIRRSMGWAELPSIIALLLMTAVYTVVGGLTTVIITDAVQGVVVILGASVLAIMSIIQLGGLDNFQSKFLSSYPSNYNNATGCGAPDALAFHLLRDITDPNYPWLGAFVGANILSAWHWCTDQLFVQRTLAAKNLSHARAGSVFAGFLKILPLLLMIVPGMISRILYTDYVACVSEEDCFRVCGIRAGCTNLAYIEIIRRMLPQGVRGIMLAAMLAALISSITSIFNSGSTLFTLDLWSRLRPKAKEMEKMLVGRLFIVALAIIGVVWLPIIDSAGGGQLVIYAQAVTSYLTPPILALFILASAWSRTTEKGVFYGLLISMTLGLSQFVLSLIFPPPKCPSEDTRIWLVRDIHFLHFAIFLFFFAIGIMVVISLLTKPLKKENLVGLTWSSLYDQQQLGEQTRQKSMSYNEEQCEEITDEKILTGESSQNNNTEAEIIDEEKACQDSGNIQHMDLEGHIKVTKGRRVLDFFMLWVCGMDTKTSSQPQQEDNDDLVEKVRQLQIEVRNGSNNDRVVNFAAILLLSIGCFLWGYFA